MYSIISKTLNWQYRNSNAHLYYKNIIEPTTNKHTC